MTSLLPSNNTQIPTYYAPETGQPQMGLTPEAKSTLMSGAMSGLMGATWFAKPNIPSGYKLIQLDKDKFEYATKKIGDSELEKEALSALKSLRSESSAIATTKANELFGEKTEIHQKELLGRFKSKEKLNKYIEAFEKRAQATVTQLLSEEPTAEIGEKQLKLLHRLDKNMVDKFKKAYPEKATTSELISFIINECDAFDGKHGNLKNLSRILNHADEKGMVSKSAAEKATRQLFIDKRLEQINECYEAIKGKLPKARLKGAMKWFGIGLAFSIASNMIWGLFSKKSQ